MLATLRARRDDDGFTLIELLVVIVIIGILAAIAIPVFLNQRQRGYDAAAKSDLKNLANFEEVYLTDYGAYGTWAQITATQGQNQKTQGTVIQIAYYKDAVGYCLKAVNKDSSSTFYWDSLSKGLQNKGATGCPVMNATNYPGGSTDVPVGP